MTTVHDFNKSLKWSHDQEDQPFWLEVYREAFGDDLLGFYSVREDGWAQRAGIDRRLCLKDGTTLTVDEKVRSENWPDILLETLSDIGRYTPGWANPRKQLHCDYIAYALVPSQVCYLLPYRLLRQAFRREGRDWWALARRRCSFHAADDDYDWERQPKCPDCNDLRRGFRIVIAANKGYKTQSIAVPTSILLSSISECMVVKWVSNG